jgi:hypothetical protein
MKTELKGYLNPDLKQNLKGLYGQKKEMAGYISARKSNYRILNEMHFILNVDSQYKYRKPAHNKGYKTLRSAVLRMKIFCKMESFC